MTKDVEPRMTRGDIIMWLLGERTPPYIIAWFIFVMVEDADVRTATLEV